MICMTVTFTILPQHEQAVIELMQQLLHHAQNEQGVLLAQIYRSQREPYHFFACIQFVSREAADAHTGSAYYGEYMMTKLYGMLESDGPTIELYKSIDER